MAISESLKIAVLMNGSSSNYTAVEASFKSAIHSVDASTKLDFYDPIIAQEYPVQADYDLVILSGGGTDPMSSEPWVLKMQEFVRATVESRNSGKTAKLMGICWGHQTIAVSLSGIVGPMSKPQMGVHTIPLTAEGTKFFSPVIPSVETIEIMEYHAREIKQAGKGLIPLAMDNQGFTNAQNTVLTLQGHPEMTEGLAKMMLPSATKSYMAIKEEELDDVAKTFEKQHDGLTIWKRVLEWAKE